MNLKCSNFQSDKKRFKRILEAIKAGKIHPRAPERSTIDVMAGEKCKIVSNHRIERIYCSRMILKIFIWTNKHIKICFFIFALRVRFFFFFLRHIFRHPAMKWSFSLSLLCPHHDDFHFHRCDLCFETPRMCKGRGGKNWQLSKIIMHEKCCV